MRPQAESSYQARLATLRDGLESLDALVVAFSGGVDSTVLLHAAREALGSRCRAIIALSPSLARSELKSARRSARELGTQLVELETRELENERYRANDGMRCYHCKRTLFVALQDWASRHGVANLAYGENADDDATDRPGAAAAAELNVSAPLRAAGFTKADVRRYAHAVGLHVASKPGAPCLASRIPVGTPVSAERLKRIETAEEQLHARGIRVLRVRDQGRGARVEVGPDDRQIVEANRAQILGDLGRLGFERVEIATYTGAGLA